MAKRNSQRAPAGRAGVKQHEENDEDQLPEDLQLHEEPSEDEDFDAVATSDAESSDQDADDAEIQAAIEDYAVTAAEEERSRELARARSNNEEDADGELAADPGSDSSEDERENRNTIGNVPLEWYKDEDHIGYDKSGAPIMKSGKKDKLTQLLDRNDSKKALRTIYDEYNDEEITLTKEELRMIMAIRKGQFPDVAVNPYEPYVDWFSRDVEKVPIRDDPVPKRRFIPSKHEEKKIVKLVRAIRKGWLKTSQEKQKAEEPQVYLLWGDDGQVEGTTKTGVGLSYIPPPKPKLPGHAESYNPPAEYLPTEEEVAGYQLLDPEDRPTFIPQAFTSLRQVPMYNNFIRDIFERCLDLYLCPRVRKKKLHVDPNQLVPKLPKPSELQPFPTHLALTFTGHTGKVRSCAIDPSGQWLASGSDDGTAKLWEVRTGRCMSTWQLGSPVHCVAWCPAPGSRLLSATAGNAVLLLPSGVGPAQEQETQQQALDAAFSAAQSSGIAGDSIAEGNLVAWSRHDSIAHGIVITHKFPVRKVSWHAKGDYFATVAPIGNTQSVLVHQLSKGASQAPFRKNRGRVPTVAFHPTKPFFFVAAANHVYVYNLAKQALAKRLLGGSGPVTCLAVHPGGDHVLVGSDDKRLAWYDLDLGDKPYKALRYHRAAVRGTAYHRSYPLFASCSDDGATQVFHGMVYSDLMTNPLLVPLKGGVITWHYNDADNHESLTMPRQPPAKGTAASEVPAPPAGPSGGGTALIKSRAVAPGTQAAEVAPTAHLPTRKGQKKGVHTPKPLPAPVLPPMASQQPSILSMPPADSSVDVLALEKRIRATKATLAETERHIYNMETQYFESASLQGNAIRGYEGLLSNASVSKSSFKPQDRIFSGSSVSGHVHLGGAPVTMPVTSGGTGAPSTAANTGLQ